MKDGWEILCKFNEMHQVMILQQALIQFGIPSSFVNKKDSAYTFMGNIEIYVPSEWIEEALQILERTEI